MQRRQIVNIVNFIRDIEPRGEVDLVEPVREQIALMKKHCLCGTFLLQYDALIDPVYTEMLKALDPADFELGVWFEIVEPQTAAAGIPWTGRYPWDWHAHCGFSVGYTKPQREKLCDVLFEKFREIFGYYPRVFGSWFFDSHTVRYLTDKYGLDALCNCKEQYGTDGYTLWGGYYGQAYYPSRKNVFMPAQTEAGQLPVPLFRMLGSDPVYQYDFGMSAEQGASRVQGVITLEPVYNGRGGGVPAWVDWFMQENYNGDCLSFGYAQAGQENSFGWPGMKNGVEYQFALFQKLADEGKIEVEPLGETGRWYKENWKATPASAITAHTAFDDPDKNSVWYSSKHYRVNLYADHGAFRIRDLHVFDENAPDPFEDKVCESNEAAYETLPLADGNRHSGNGTVAGIRLFRDGEPIRAGEMRFEDTGSGTARVRYETVTAELKEDGLALTADGDFSLKNCIGQHGNHLPEVISCGEKELRLRYHGVNYSVALKTGLFVNPTEIRSEGGRVEAILIHHKD